MPRQAASIFSAATIFSLLISWLMQAAPTVALSCLKLGIESGTEFDDDKGSVGMIDSMMTNLPPLSTQTLWAILNNDMPDDVVNQLVWQTLGYKYSQQTQGWQCTDSVDATWQEKYPEPPNFIESRPATVQLTRSIPKENKQLLKTYLGFKGYSVDQLVPRLTRRATMANWLLSVMRTKGLIDVESE